MDWRYLWKMLPPMAIPSVWPRPRKKENIETAKAKFLGWEAAWSCVCRAGKSLSCTVSREYSRETRLAKHLHAKTNTDDQVREDDLSELCLRIDRTQECHSEGRQSPSTPDCPTELARLADGDTSHDGHWSYGERCGKEGYTGDDRAVPSDAFEVERLIVEQSPQCHAVERCRDVCNVCRPVREDDEAQDGLLGNLEFVKSSQDEADDSSAEWNRDSPAEPVVLHATPADGNEDRCHAPHKHEGADPVGLL